MKLKLAAGLGAMALTLIACTALWAGPARAGTVKGKKILMVVSPTNFQDREFLACRDAFVQDGAKVKVASLTMERARGMSGTLVTPDTTLKNAEAGEYDALVFIGGPGATVYWDHADARRLVHDAMEENKVLAAICLAPVTLARAGALNGRPCTVWPDAAREMTEAGCDYKKEPVVVSGRTVTANGPDAALDFAKKVEEVLSK